MFCMRIGSASASSRGTHCASLRGAGAETFTLRKLECSRQAVALNTLAWNNTIGPRFYFVGF